MRPLPRSTMWASAAWQRKNAPERFTASTLCQSSSVIAATVLSIAMKATRPANLSVAGGFDWRGADSSTSVMMAAPFLVGVQMNSESATSAALAPHIP
jgi:hypothetical protein